LIVKAATALFDMDNSSQNKNRMAEAIRFSTNYFQYLEQENILFLVQRGVSDPSNCNFEEGFRGFC